MLKQPFDRMSLNHLNEELESLSIQVFILENTANLEDPTHLVEIEKRVDEISNLLDQAYRQTRIREIGLRLVA